MTIVVTSIWIRDTNDVTNEMKRSSAPPSRGYHSPGRDNAKAETRATIVNAVVKVILEQGIHDFTMQSVAKAAGVSQRTVYRHFRTRDALLEGLLMHLHWRVVAAGLAPPENVAAWATYAAPLFEHFSRMRDAMRASVIAAVALGYQPHQQLDSLGVVRRSLGAHFRHLSPTELREAAAALRVLLGRYTWYTLAVELELDATEVARSASWAVSALLRDLERRNHAAAHQPSKSSSPPKHATTHPPKHKTSLPPRHRTSPPPKAGTPQPPKHATTAPPKYATSVPPKYATTVPPKHAIVPPKHATSVPPRRTSTIPPKTAPPKTVPPKRPTTIPPRDRGR
jgi:AcrR family transcriptional regulator